MDDLTALVRTALAEDVGAGDVTTLATVDAQARGSALITQKAPGAIYGLDAAEATFALLDPDARFERLWRRACGASRVGRCCRSRPARGRC